MPKHNIDRLQSVLRSAARHARLTLRLPSSASVTDLMASNSRKDILQTVHVGIQMPAQPCAVISDGTVCSCGCCSWTYAAMIGCQGRSRDSCYTNKNYWSTLFFICLSVGLERSAYAFERLFHDFHNFQKQPKTFVFSKY